MTAQLNFRREPEQTDGLRSLKKVKTRAAIEEAAITLFVVQGYEATTVEQIAGLAEISTATFFRYFPNKSDVILCSQDAQLPALAQTIVDHPAEANDLVTIRDAILEIWTPMIDPDRTRRTARVIAESALLRGLYDDISRSWVRCVSEALARRHGLAETDDRCNVVARVALSIFGGSSEAWIAKGCRGDLCEVIRRNFDTILHLRAR